MYHYVRSHDAALDHQRYLHVDAFRRQLDWLDREHGFIGRPAFEEALATGRPAPGVVLTFDDALRDHAEVVLPILVDRGLWGIFYVPTAPYRTGRLLAVHRLHLLLGSVPASQVLPLLGDIVDDDMLAHDHVEAFHTETYGRIDDDAATDQIKRTLNYLIDGEHRDSAIDALLAATGLDEGRAAERYHVAPDDLRAMHDAGMVIGSHGDAHVALSTMSADEQRSDLATSLAVLGSIVGAPIETYCYPYGGHHSFDEDSLRLLHEHGIRYAFNVEGRPIEAADLRDHPLALPRFDCKALPHGRAHRGRSRPA